MSTERAGEMEGSGQQHRQHILWGGPLRQYLSSGAHPSWATAGWTREETSVEGSQSQAVGKMSSLTSFLGNLGLAIHRWDDGTRAGAAMFECVSSRRERRSIGEGRMKSSTAREQRWKLQPWAGERLLKAADLSQPASAPHFPHLQFLPSVP